MGQNRALVSPLTRLRAVHRQQTTRKIIVAARIGIALFVCACVLPLVSMAAEPDSSPAAASTERCVQLSRVKSTQVLDKQQIVFELSNKHYYINELPHPCPSLRRDSTILYRTSIDLLCDVDVITVLNSFGGGWQPGASCGLGKFEPVSAAELKELRAAARN